MVGTSNIELNNLLNKYHRYLGAWSADNAPPTFPVGSGIIFNLQDSDQGGSHWTCAINDKKLGKIYIDPYGYPPNEHISSFLNNEGGFKQYKYNKTQFQPNDSTQCGLYCAKFLKNYFNGKDITADLDHKPTEHNDTVVKSLMR